MKTIIVGEGDVGKALFKLLEDNGFNVQFYDNRNGDKPPSDVETVHIAFPCQDMSFIGDVVEYIKQLKPKLTIIDSTVIPGTTRAIYNQFKEDGEEILIVHSPVRGQHDSLYRDLKRYVKFIGPMTGEAGVEAIKHFTELGLKVVAWEKPEETELCKLLDTSQYGILIAWAQQALKYCEIFEVDHEKVRVFGEETQEFYGLRPKIYPGFIGGVCVVPNLKLLNNFVAKSEMIEAALKSNEEFRKKYGEVRLD